MPKRQNCFSTFLFPLLGGVLILGLAVSCMNSAPSQRTTVVEAETAGTEPSPTLSPPTPTFVPVQSPFNNALPSATTVQSSATSARAAVSVEPTQAIPLSTPIQAMPGPSDPGNESMTPVASSPAVIQSAGQPAAPLASDDKTGADKPANQGDDKKAEPQSKPRGDAKADKKDERKGEKGRGKNK